MADCRGRCRECHSKRQTRRTFDPIVYVAYAQHPQPNTFAFVRTAIEPEGLVGPIRRELYGLDQDLPLPTLGTLAARFARTYAVEHQSSIVVLCFAAATLLVAALGLYATVSRSVNSRVKGNRDPACDRRDRHRHCRASLRSRGVRRRTWMAYRNSAVGQFAEDCGDAHDLESRWPIRLSRWP